ncbi:MAG: DUF302 domain-containing protein [Candidatus Eisenbacteria bacterium]|jgi:uncharacterized protein (DUF302 family)|nr:DUF302 domain-containing protein [Candidatus Eisenbacteria bacterium]
MLDTEYGFTRTLKGISYEDARRRIEAALKAEGFGVLTEIDVRATLRAKLNVDFPNYVILGACNPTLAHQALSTDPGVGLLLPCNVVVRQDDEGSAVVSILDPEAMLKVAPHSAGLEGPMREARERLQRALGKA